jgi:Protein of unknown function (DUF2905)
MQEIGKWVIIAGFFLSISGVILYFFGDKLYFLGNLPGDFKLEKENFKFYFPVTTMITLSVLIHLLSRLIKYFIH